VWLESRVNNARAILAHLGRDPVLAPLIEQHGPPRLQSVTEPERLFARLVDAIISQQISVRVADAIYGRLEAAMPEGRVSPAGVLGLGEAGLRAVGASGAKARSLLDLSARVAGSELRLERLPELDDDAVVAHLTQVKGIGVWTSHMVLIFALGRPDILPVGDLGFRTAVQRQYALEHLPAPSDLEQIAEPWRPYRSYGTWYLWRSLENAPG
jgi:DNA-3-methyladenine glycosylase II